ncbi:class I SAM-dependent methyltransferase [Arthrobacter sp. zg-Y826]|uniref:class I SAM-dependent methyltransferase n=1 Tax=Arthrobacter jinronghuae TaxID=2964609 RepID=UPI002102AAE6|nr:methyltransferase domain-containing protein [Arthrobacter jinronghuae]MCQ1956473.1 class I SAM-dependent methyltransferase [Arthrobacter jinronghuae]
MMPSADLDSYAKKMLRLVEIGTDLEVDARFIDMLAPRNSRILDVGCGIGSAVNALRQSGHHAYGIDPARAVLDVAADIFDSDWYRQLAVDELSDERLRSEGLPGRYEVILMSGNVPAFLSSEALQDAFRRVCGLLVDGGLFVVGTTVDTRGGPQAQDAAAGSAGLPLLNRFSDWHLGAFDEDSGWSVSVYAKPGALNTRTGPDGIFILKR